MPKPRTMRLEAVPGIRTSEQDAALAATLLAAGIASAREIGILDARAASATRYEEAVG